MSTKTKTNINFNTIIHPVTKKVVSLNSQEGGNILADYVKKYTENSQKKNKNYYFNRGISA